MNERIRELAKQATTITYEDDGWRLYGTEVETFNKQKFAELIVRECANIALKSGSVSNKSEVAVAEADRIYHKIQEHFGVEQ
jgi:tellurite resistance protein